MYGEEPLDTRAVLEHALKSRTASVAVVGIGYVGLPLALRAAEAGYKVVGLDRDSAKVRDLSAGKSPLVEFADSEIERCLATGRFSVTTDAGCLTAADVVVICVPTPLVNGSPDMCYIDGSARTIAAHLRQGQLVILESTTYPGTTEAFLRDILETTGLKAGTDFFLGFSPERIDPGNHRYHLGNVPKIVGGFNTESAELMEAFYGSFVEEVVRVSSPRAAEMAKLLENTYRHVNIALANEMAILCNDLGINIWEVIEAASTKPFGFQAFYPGPGWGGHCIPVDPAYLSWSVRQMGLTAKFVDLAREFNERMPAYVLQRLQEVLQEHGKALEGSTILVLGVAYKPDVNDARESPAIQIIDQLRAAGARVEFSDPYVDRLGVQSGTITSSDLTVELLSGADLVLLHTSHSVYDPEWLAANSRLIFDARNFFKGVRGPIVTL